MARDCKVSLFNVSKLKTLLSMMKSYKKIFKPVKQMPRESLSVNKQHDR